MFQKGLNGFFGFFNPEDIKGGLIRLVLFSAVVMTALRWFVNPAAVSFPVGMAGSGDYWSMIGMSALLIAIDAMLIVLLSWSKLRTWRDVLGVAAMVGGTHVLFPLLTFAITAGTAIGTQALGLPHVFALVLSSGIIVLAIKRWIRSRELITQRVYGMDWIGSLALVCVFMHFSIFAAVYVLYTFVPRTELLETGTIWGLTALIFTTYLIFGPTKEIKEAARARTAQS